MPDHAYGIAPSGNALPPASRLGRVRLCVSDLQRSVAYYRDVLGLHVHDSRERDVTLGIAGTDDVLVQLHEDPRARPVPRGGLLGLYHFALLLPSRVALGQFVRHLARRKVQFGAADHLVSEAIYLWDPDGLGIEVYADRPRETWQARNDELVMTTERLDLRELVETAEVSPEWQGLARGTVVGHMHLSVGDLHAARRFYHEALGLTLTVWSYPGALFLAAGGYHHHLGVNTWTLAGRPSGDHDARLLEWELVLPAAADVAAAEAALRAGGYTPQGGRIVDPWGTALRLTTESSSPPPAA
jgi:catechol 2,3-dioxygenase